MPLHPVYRLCLPWEHKLSEDRDPVCFLHHCVSSTLTGSGMWPMLNDYFPEGARPPVAEAAADRLSERLAASDCWSVHGQCRRRARPSRHAHVSPPGVCTPVPGARPSPGRSLAVLRTVAERGPGSESCGAKEREDGRGWQIYLWEGSSFAWVAPLVLENSSVGMTVLWWEQGENRKLW